MLLQAHPLPALVPAVRVIQHCCRVFQDGVPFRYRDHQKPVLDSAQVGQVFDDLYIETVLHPEKLGSSVESLVQQVQEQVKDALEATSVLQSEKRLDPTEAQRLLDHPLSYWIERMVVAYLGAHGGTAKRQGKTWDLTWPTGENTKGIVFSSRDVDTTPSAFHLTFEDS